MKGNKTKDQPDPLIGTTLANCLVESVAGEGGMGVVYRGRHLKLDRPVAIKVLAKKIARDPIGVKRFMREAQTAAKLRHDNLVQIYDVQNAELTYMVMEYVDGRDLGEILKEDGAIDPHDAARYVLQTSRGLAAAHEAAKIVHRDIKPDNLILTDEGLIKVTDFGLARTTMLDAQASRVTQTGQILGTPSFMSPEQCCGEEVDHRSDIYSLGMTLYCLLTGTPAFDGPITTVLMAHMDKIPPEPHEVVREVPPTLSAITMKMIAKDAAHRYQSMAEITLDLEAFLDPDTADPVPTVPARAARGAAATRVDHSRERPSRRASTKRRGQSQRITRAGIRRSNPMPMLLAGGAAVVVLLLIIILGSGPSDDPDPRPEQPKVVRETAPPTKETASDKEEDPQPAESDARLVLDTARSALASGDKAGALESFDRYCALRTDDWNVARELVELAIELGKSKLALTHLGRFVNDNTELHWALTTRASVHMKAKAYRLAVEDLEYALREREDPQVRLLLARAFLADDRPVDAARQVTHASVRGRPEAKPILVDLRPMIRTKFPPQSRFPLDVWDVLQALCDTDPDFYYYHISIGIYRITRKEYQTAKAHFDLAMSQPGAGTRPHDWLGFMGRATVAYYLHQYRSARQYAAETMWRIPTSHLKWALAASIAGCSEVHLGKMAEARRTLTLMQWHARPRTRADLKRLVSLLRRATGSVVAAKPADARLRYTSYYRVNKVEDATLKVADMITEIERKPVEGFQTSGKMVADLMSGNRSSLAVTVQRGKETLALTLTTAQVRGLQGDLYVKIKSD